MNKNQILFLLLLFVGSAFKSFAQHDLNFEINKVLPSFSILESNLDKINTLTDLDKRYPSSWIREYISVEISAYKNGSQTKVIGTGDVLNQEQKDLILQADRNSEIAVSVMYLPENTMKDNTVKLHDFRVTIMPDKDAVYSEGQEKLIEYFQKNSIGNIQAGSFTGFDLTAIKFTINEAGHVADIKVALPSKDADIDRMLVSAISKMETWKPAEFSNGLKVKQDYVLTIGNMDNCMVNLLNIRPIE